MTLVFTTFVIFATPATAQRNNDDGVLRILAIGNSFSDDGMEHLPALLENLGVESVELARLYVGGCSLMQHTHFYKNQSAAYMFYHSKAGENRWSMQNPVTMQHALNMGEWDIISLQQVSGDSGVYDSFLPYLQELIDIVRTAQPKAEIVWHMTWAYSSKSPHGDFPKYDCDQQKMFEAIQLCVRNLKKEHKEIKTIIASGTAIQSLRMSEVNNPPMDFTRDGYHLDLGNGRYAAACVWYETLIEPYTHISMVGNTLRPEVGSPVTEQMAPYIHKAASRAVKCPFRVREIKVKR